MKVRILSKNDLPNIEKIQKEFDIFRVVKVKTREKLDMVEFFNKDGVFRGFGKDTKAAYKKSEESIKKVL